VVPVPPRVPLTSTASGTAPSTWYLCADDLFVYNGSVYEPASHTAWSHAAGGIVVPSKRAIAQPCEPWLTRHVIALQTTGDGAHDCLLDLGDVRHAAAPAAGPAGDGDAETTVIGEEAPTQCWHALTVCRHDVHVITATSCLPCWTAMMVQPLRTGSTATS